ncbi:Alpha/Beta hydrolase protein [Aspergillus cavernicola]|uniref:feruloyl esterase n=1 Tax=Aspergillus cavernicola TaxID=176166 RepID=A0ABR4IRX3_9EURO
MLFSLFIALSAAATLGHAAPSPVQRRDISTSELAQFSFWVQYAAAAYCPTDYTAEPGSKVTCWAGNCPQVEQAGATILYDFSDTTITDTAGYIAVDNTNKAHVLAFRGSYSVRNWVSDATFIHKDPGLCDGCKAEAGFWDSWVNVRDDVLEQLDKAVSQNPDYQLVVVGHSLGAAVATLAAADLRHRGYSSTTLYAFAAPRVANSALASYITAQNNNYRFTHTNDPVPKLPLLSMGYVHISPEYWITAPDNATVSASEVEVLQGEVNLNGNTGTGIPDVPDLTAFAAHHWYFEKADACIGPGLPFKRSLPSQ